MKKIPFDIQKDEFGIAFILGTLYAITALWLTEAYLYIPSGVATTIHFLYPVVVSLIMFVFYKDKLTMPILLAMAMAVSGVYMLSGGNTPGGSINMKGLMLVLATVVAYATYIVGMNRSRIARLDSLKATFYILLSGAIVFLINLAIKGDLPDPMPNLDTTIDVLMVAFLPTLVSDLTLILAIRYIGSTTTAILGCMEPLTAVCMGVLFLEEHLQPIQIGGIVVVLSAVCIVISGSYIRKWMRDIRFLFMRRI
ncbi:EamA family transporter [Parabacteroides johnsonii]|nr:EamA family transporter [Parabacteroides johnsonii]